MSTQPTVGCIVHYRSYGTPGGEYEPECRAAIVTEVNDRGEVGLAVLNPTGLFFHPIAHENGPCRQDDPSALTGGTWHWPCVRTDDIHWDGNGGVPHLLDDPKMAKTTDVPSRITCRECREALS